MHASTMREIDDELLDATRESQRQVVGSADALAHYLVHAENAERLKVALRDRQIEIKRGFANLDLDYQIAQHAIWIAELVERLRDEYPELCHLGPSLVLLVREAERRMRREGRAEDLRDLVNDLVSGMPRSAVRERHLPKKGVSAIQEVLRLARAGRIEPARRAFGACSANERTELQLFAKALTLVCTQPDSIAGAVLALTADARSS